MREVEQLANGYFRGLESFRKEIRKGNMALPFERMRQVPRTPTGVVSLSGRSETRCFRG